MLTTLHHWAQIYSRKLIPSARLNSLREDDVQLLIFYPLAKNLNVNIIRRDILENENHIWGYWMLPVFILQRRLNYCWQKYRSRCPNKLVNFLSAVLSTGMFLWASFVKQDASFNLHLGKTQLLHPGFAPSRGSLKVLSCW